MNEKQIQFMKKCIEMGKWNYTLKYGFLRYGLPMFVIMYLLNEGFKFNIKGLIVNFIIFTMFGGFVFGLSMWYMYRNNLKKQDKL